MPSQAQSSAPEVWLVTYGPGEIYWQRFGHNGIWIRDEGLGLDHVFNFGFFDFEQEGFTRQGAGWGAPRTIRKFTGWIELA
jgi:hypothetical protein